MRVATEAIVCCGSFPWCALVYKQLFSNTSTLTFAFIVMFLNAVFKGISDSPQRRHLV